MLDINYLVKKHKLNDLEKNILLYIQNKISENQKLSIRETAKENYTSTTVIYSCIKKIGFQSFTDLIFYLKNPSDKSNSCEIDLTIPLKILKENSDPLIMFCSIGIANNITSYMNERMALLGKRSISNAHLQLLENSTTKKIVLFVVSESGETQSLLDIIQIAKKNGIPIISFLGKASSSIEKSSDFSFILNHGIFFANVISKI